MVQSSPQEASLHCHSHASRLAEGEGAPGNQAMTAQGFQEEVTDKYGGSQVPTEFVCVFYGVQKGTLTEAGRKSWIDVRLRAGGGAKHLMKMLIRNKAGDDTQGGGLCGESRPLCPHLHFIATACFHLFHTSLLCPLVHRSATAV